MKGERGAGNARRARVGMPGFGVVGKEPIEVREKAKITLSVKM